MAESSPLAHSPTLVQGTGPDGAPASDSELAEGAKVGEYVVDRFLGAGAMGEVYAGVQPVIGKKVAIKVLKREVGATADGAERFKREARAVNQIDHPNVIDVFSFGRLDDGRLYLVMDLVEGRSLRKAITAGPLPLAIALDVLEQIADALDAAHAKGVVHRDLKPDNVMLSGGPDSSTGKVFVLDFGLAKLLTPEGTDPKQSMLTGQGTWLGTPGYMAPEQWSADGAGPASDRYALGVMAFELLAGALPFEAKSLPQMMEQHFRAKVPALSARGAIALPSAFDPIVSRAMAKDPDERFASAREMVDALRAAAGKKGARAAAPVKRPWVPAAIGVGVLALGVGAVLTMRHDEATDRRTEPAVAPPAGNQIRIAIDSVPRGATVTRGTMTATTTTPTYLDASDGQTIAFDLAKPGYAPSHYEVVARAGLTIEPIQLVAISGFEGVWMLPDGGLRAFHRDGERVTASKLASVNGTREFFRQYTLVAATSGATFSSTENIHEPGRPEHASCYFAYTTEYHYDPSTDHLTVRRENITSDVLDGKCIRRSSKMTEPEDLVRADRGSSTERSSLAPAGTPTNIDTITMPPKDNLAKDSLTKDDLAKKAALNEKKKPDLKPVPKAVEQAAKTVKNVVQKALPDKKTQAEPAPPPQQLQRQGKITSAGLGNQPPDEPAQQQAQPPAPQPQAPVPQAQAPEPVKQAPLKPQLKKK